MARCGKNAPAVSPVALDVVKLSDVDPLAWLADVPASITGIPQGQLHELLPLEWKCATSATAPTA